MITYESGDITQQYNSQYAAAHGVTLGHTDSVAQEGELFEPSGFVTRENNYTSFENNLFEEQFYNPNLDEYDLKLVKSFKLAKCGPGKVMGEKSMIYRNDETRTRLLSGIVTTDICIVMALNHIVFDVLVKEKTKKELEDLASFIYENVAGLSANYTYNKILNHADHNWKSKEISKGEIL